MSCTSHHNACACREETHRKEVEGLRAYHEGKDRLWRKAVCERADRTRQRDDARTEVGLLRVALEKLVAAFRDEAERNVSLSFAMGKGAIPEAWAFAGNTLERLKKVPVGSTDAKGKQ